MFRVKSKVKVKVNRSLLYDFDGKVVQKFNIY